MLRRSPNDEYNALNVHNMTEDSIPHFLASNGKQMGVFLFIYNEKYNKKALTMTGKCYFNIYLHPVVHSGENKELTEQIFDP